MKRIVDLRIELDEIDENTPTAEQIKDQITDDLHAADIMGTVAVLSTEDTL